MSSRPGLVIVAAGSSRRMAGVDKVWADLGGHPVVWHSLQALAPLAAHTVLVVSVDRVERARAELDSTTYELTVVAGGAQRQESVARGLAALHDHDVVAVHDAARPFATARLLRSGIELLRECDAAIPALPVTDTVKQVDDRGHVLATLDRAWLRAAQTPQVFRREALVAAHAAQDGAGAGATDDAVLLEAAGLDVRVFPGQADNFKITTEFDLRLARMLSAAAAHA